MSNQSPHKVESISIRDHNDTEPIAKIVIQRVTRNRCRRIRAPLAKEIPFTIVANGTTIATLYTLPTDLHYLTLGYLFTSGYIDSPKEMEDYTCDKRLWTVNVHLPHKPDPLLTGEHLHTIGNGRCPKFSTIKNVSLRKKREESLKISEKMVFEIASRLQKGTSLYNETRSVHCSLLIEMDTKREIIIEDVARHNALDKVVGRALVEGIDFTNCILARTGRTSSEMIYKVRRCGIVFTIARGAPTHYAIHLARDMGITVIGFARPDSFNLYSCSERIVRQ